MSYPDVDISVIIPTHNCLEWLPKALNSALTQEGVRLEVLVVDDNSSDQTWPWLLEQQQQDPRIRPFLLDGRGVAYARNFALRQARGTYVAFLDADDEWLPGKLAKQWRYHQTHPDAVLSFTDYEHVTPEGASNGPCFVYWPRFNEYVAHRFHERGYHTLPQALGWIFAENVIGTSTVMARTDALFAIKGFNETLTSASDWECWLRLCQQGEVGFLRRSTCRYLQRPGSITSKGGKRVECFKEIVHTHQGAAMKVQASSLLYAYARLAVARAEWMRGSARHASAFWSHAMAWVLAPSKRGIRAMGFDMVQVLGLKH